MTTDRARVAAFAAFLVSVAALSAAIFLAVRFQLSFHFQLDNPTRVEFIEGVALVGICSWPFGLVALGLFAFGRRLGLGIAPRILAVVITFAWFLVLFVGVNYN